jgi:hypothetical protein
MDHPGDSTSGLGHSMLPLPLYLIAMIITYVRDKFVLNKYDVTKTADGGMTSLTNPQTSHGCVEVVERSTI